MIDRYTYYIALVANFILVFRNFMIILWVHSFIRSLFVKNVANIVSYFMKVPFGKVLNVDMIMYMCSFYCFFFLYMDGLCKITNTHTNTNKYRLAY